MIKTIINWLMTSIVWLIVAFVYFFILYGLGTIASKFVDAEPWALALLFGVAIFTLMYGGFKTNNQQDKMDKVLSELAKLKKSADDVLNKK